MAPPPHRSQGKVLYKRGWNRSADAEFIGHLAGVAFNEGRLLPNPGKKLLSDAIATVNRRLGTRYNLDDANYQFTRLRKRYDAYAYLTTSRRVRYDPETNKLEADDDMWELLCLRNHIAEAYIDTGEPFWRELRLMFGQPPSCQHQPGRLHVQISDDSHNTCHDNTSLCDQQHHERNVESSNRDTRVQTEFCNTGFVTLNAAYNNNNLGAGIWNNLDPLVGYSLSDEQDSVRYKPNRGLEVREDILSYSPNYQPFWSHPNEECNFRFTYSPPKEQPTTSRASSSATPKGNLMGMLLCLFL